jgi:LysR family glycine cleavage system transcriptional activator
MSIKNAAEELFVTQAAVSQQIRQLEEALGAALFIRKHRAIEITAFAKELLGYVNSGFETVELGLETIFTDPKPNAIALSVLPSFASRWLIPRLGSFYETCPDLTLNLQMSDKFETFTTGNVDLAIRFGRGDYDGLESQDLMGELIYPVCHPDYLKRNPVEQIEDLKSVRVLDDVVDNLAWESWLEAKGAKVNFSDRVRFDGSHYVIESALSGQGVAMARHCLMSDAIVQGLLIPILGEPVEMDYRYAVCGPQRMFEREKIKRFLSWLKKEVRKFEVETKK